MDDVERAQDWSAGGKYGLVLQAVSGAAGANVSGSTSAFVQGAAVNYLQGLAASEVKQIADMLGKGAQAEAARAALHGIVGCAGAAGQGAACASGALGASAGSILNSLMGSPEGLAPEQVEARRNLVTSLVAGIATAAGAEAATAGTAAALETSQNWGQLAIPAVGVAARACASMRICDRAVTYVSDKVVYVAVQMKDGAIYVGTAALVGVTAASDAVGDWVSEFVGSAVGSEAALPSKPGEVVHVSAPPPLPSEKETFGSEIPVWPGESVGPIAVPGQENNGPSGGLRRLRRCQRSRRRGSYLIKRKLQQVLGSSSSTEKLAINYRRGGGPRKTCRRPLMMEWLEHQRISVQRERPRTGCLETIRHLCMGPRMGILLLMTVRARLSKRVTKLTLIGLPTAE